MKRKSRAAMMRPQRNHRIAPWGFSSPRLLRVCEGRCDVAKDNRVVVLCGLAGRDSLVSTVDRGELVTPNVGGSGRAAEKETLNGNDINRRDVAVPIDISCRQWAARQE